MGSVLARARRWIMKNRSRVPIIGWAMQSIRDRPRGRMSILAFHLSGGDRHRPEAIAEPPGDLRVLVGPTNYAGQGHLWSRALETHIPGLSARSTAVDTHTGFEFPVDNAVAVSIYRHSKRWQDAQFEAISRGFTHVLLESMRPMTGHKFNHLTDELHAFSEAGVSVALLAHGTDVRSPLRHARMNRWSPFADDAESARLERLASANREVAVATGLPLFVSTPDLLDDLPDATWCPVVVDPRRWQALVPPLSGMRPPVVVHSASAPRVKGTDMVDPILQAWHEQGRITYQRLTGVPHSELPEMVKSADIVLDQFRIGSYGVAACEAMAAGRVVVGHVTQHVRDRVRALTQRDLPVVEATPETLESTLASLIEDPTTTRKMARQGVEFVEAVHGGAFSADVLWQLWLTESRREPR